MLNVILQSLGIDLVNSNVFAKVYQNIANGLKDVGFFLELSGDTQLHKLSGDTEGVYRAPSDSQSSASLSVNVFGSAYVIIVLRTAKLR